MKVSRIVLSYLLGFVVSILKLTISPMAATEPPRTIPKPTLQSGKKVAIRIRRPHKGLLTKTGCMKRKKKFLIVWLFGSQMSILGTYMLSSK